VEGLYGGPTELGLIEQVAPVGQPLTLNPTVPVYPLIGFTVSV
jgi:hypothetical protein